MSNSEFPRSVDETGSLNRPLQQMADQNLRLFAGISPTGFSRRKLEEKTPPAKFISAGGAKVTRLEPSNLQSAQDVFW